MDRNFDLRSYVLRGGERVGYPEAVDVRAAAALISGLFGKLADEGDLIFFAQRQK